MSLDSHEEIYLKKRIDRPLSTTEQQILAAEWSEHCSYKSSKKFLKILPMKGPRVITEKGYDSGVLDVGNGNVVTVHIESHNHPSAIEPYGGAATGVGGVIRDILSAGTRPIAILNSLRFGDVENESGTRWLLKNAVKGIADYGNCLGIPTVGGELEFDSCYSGYTLIDVMCLGFGKKEDLIKNHCAIGDIVVLLGGPTGKDGVGGSQFASDSLEEENRSAVQIPDPFIEKLIIEAILECREQGCIKAMKDLGGGGLSCAISELSFSLSSGMEIELNQVHTRENNLSSEEIMTSESQERMLIITDNEKLEKLLAICEKFRIPCSQIGKVTKAEMMTIKNSDKFVANLPTELVANAPLLEREYRFPNYLNQIEKNPNIPSVENWSLVLLKLLSSPNLCSKHWVYQQYDHEVGIRTEIKPGMDASVLRLYDDKHLAVKIDGNPKHCFLDPKQGVMGCFEEACRNVVCTGAKPIGMVDHLQFGNPENPEIFWTFVQSLEGIKDFSLFFEIPCVGGKVSFYNETSSGPIKPSPLIGILGLNDQEPLKPTEIESGDSIFLIGLTKNELGGSEYLEYIHKIIGGICPQVSLSESKSNMHTVLNLISKNWISNAHDCSKGGLAIAISELCIQNHIGCEIDLEKIKSDTSIKDALLFSETHSRYILVVKPENKDRVFSFLNDRNVDFSEIGKFEGDQISFFDNSNKLINISIDKADLTWRNSLGEIISNG